MILNYSDFIKVICLNHFMGTLHIPLVDLDSLPIYREPCTLLVLQLNRSMLEYFGDQECTSLFGLEYTRKLVHPTVKQKHQILNYKCVLLNLLIMVLLNLIFVEG